MDDPYATSRLTAEGSTWELRTTRPEWGGGTPSIEYELVKLDGDTTLNDFGVELREDGTGEVYGDDRYIPLSSGVPARGTLYAASDAETLLLAVVGYPEDGDPIDLTTISGLAVPERPDTDFEMVDSPLPIPTWAAPMGDSIVVTPPGEPEPWTEAVIESVDLTHYSGDRFGYEVTVGSTAVVGEPQEITRDIWIGDGYVYQGQTPSYGEPETTATVTIPPGERVVVEGEFTAPEPDPEYPIQAYVEDTARDLPAVEYESGNDPFDMGPQDTIKIPAPTDIEQLKSNPNLAADAVDAPVDGYTYYGSRTDLVPDTRFVTALLDYRAGRISDLQMARLHALYQKEGVAQHEPLAKDQPPREGGPVLVGMDDSGTVHIHNDREAAPDLFGYGPLLEYDDTDFEYPRGAAPRSPLQDITGLLGGREYTFGFDEEALESYSDPLPDLNLRAFGYVEIPEPEPEPEPEPDPDPVVPTTDVTCSTDTDTITAGEQVTVVGDVTAGDGDTDADVTVRLAVAGESATESVTVAPNSSATVEATFEITEPGEYVPEVTIE